MKMKMLLNLFSTIFGLKTRNSALDNRGKRHENSLPPCFMHFEAISNQEGEKHEKRIRKSSWKYKDLY